MAEKKTNQTQPKYGLGYVHSDSSESEGGNNNDPWRAMYHITSVVANTNDREGATSDNEDCTRVLYFTGHDPCKLPLMLIKG